MALSMRRKLTYDQYGVAIICPMEVEMSAVRYMLDEEHDRLPLVPNDSNRYICGRMSGHNVVIVHLPHGSQGIGAAAMVATDLKRSFPNATLRLLVGIGGGVPSNQNDIRLGDVVVSMPTGAHGGVVQYDLGKDTVTGFERKGFLEPPPTAWRNCVVEMISDHRVKDNRITVFINEMIKKYPRLSEYARPVGEEKDMLFLARSQHRSGQPLCDRCDHNQLIVRQPRPMGAPHIFYGTIASGNRVVKNAELRDQIAYDAGGAMCFEMEAAGLMNDFRCIVIRGISDYADSHKNDGWHPYAAAVAAGCAKELLFHANSGEDFHTASDSFGRNQHWTIGRVTNPHFLGRTELIAKVSKVIRKSLRDVARTDQCRIVITGMGGLGKSEICLHLANAMRAWFWGVFWVDVSTTVLAESGFRAVATRLNLTTSAITDVLTSLANVSQPWLLILDNADDANTNYDQYFPPSSAGTILLTSRRSDCQVYATDTVCAISLDNLASEHACALLAKTADIPWPCDASLSQCLASVSVSLLTGHPLAIIQAGSYISQGYCTLTQYPDHFQQQRKRLLTFQPKQAQSRRRDIYAAFEASADMLQLSIEETNTDALWLLCALSMLASDPLPMSVFRTAWAGARAYKAISESAHQYEDDGDEIEETFSFVFPHFLRYLSRKRLAQLLPLLGIENEVWNSFRLIQARCKLEEHSLVLVMRNETNTSISMHPLSHAWAQDRQSLVLQQQSWLSAACVLACSYLWQRTPDFEQCRQDLRAHLSALLSVQPSIILENRPRRFVGDLLQHLGHLLKVLQLDEKLPMICQLAFECIGADSRIVDKKWLGLYELATECLFSCGRFDEAIALSKQIVEQCSAGNRDLLMIWQRNLVSLYLHNGQAQEATLLLRQMIERPEQTIAHYNPLRVSSQQQLALIYDATGQTHEVVTLLEQIVRTREQTLPEEDDHLLHLRHQLASALISNGQAHRAISFLEQEIRAEESVLQQDHPLLLNLRQVLARVYNANGQVWQASALLEQVIWIKERTLPAYHPSLLWAKKCLATTYAADRQFQRASDMIRQVVSIAELRLEQDHPDLLEMKLVLSDVLWHSEHRLEACQVLQPLTTILQSKFPPQWYLRTSAEQLLAKMEAYFLIA